MTFGLKIACASAALMASTSAYAQARAWMVSEVSGRVVVRDAAGDHAVQRGASIAPGATVMTAPGAHAVLVRDEDFVTVNPASRLRVADGSQPGGLIQMVQEWGNAVFRIKHQAQPHFAVQTPYLAAVVKGTSFSITVTQAATSLQVLDGAVEAATSDGGAHELIRPGSVAMVAAGDRFRLAVQGQNAHVVDSPARATAPGAAPAGPTQGPAAARAAPNAAGLDDSVAWSDVSSAVIAAPIEAKPVDLAAETGGLVRGSTATTLAFTEAASRTLDSVAGQGVSGSDRSDGAGAEAREPRSDAAAAHDVALTVDATAEHGLGKGKDTAAHGNDVGAGNGSGNVAPVAATGNGNAGGNGNANAGGNGNGNAGGNGNGNAGGNGNATGSGSGNANQGVGSAAGNGNSGTGNDATGAAGTAGGNANANANAKDDAATGNANANGGGNDNSNAGGNGNSNAGGNGNGNGNDPGVSVKSGVSSAGDSDAAVGKAAKAKQD